MSAPGAATAEFELLQAAFVEYSAALHDSSSEAGKARLGHLAAQLQAHSLQGANGLELLQRHAAQIAWEGMAPDLFGSFYRFVYFLCREPGKRNVQVSTAVAAWRAMLRGRFRLLDRFCAYVAAHHKAAIVSEDTWRQVLDFARCVHEDLSNYDPASAWPVLLDDFVDHLKGPAHCRGSPPVEPMDVLAPWARPMTAVVPRSGSKRRPPDVEEVTDQLASMPLASSAGPAGGSSSGRCPAPRGAHGGGSAGGGGGCEPADALGARLKRLRAARSTSPPDGLAAPLHHRCGIAAPGQLKPAPGLFAAGGGGERRACSPLQQQQQRLQQRSQQQQQSGSQPPQQQPQQQQQHGHAAHLGQVDMDLSQEQEGLACCEPAPLPAPPQQHQQQQQSPPQQQSQPPGLLCGSFGWGTGPHSASASAAPPPPCPGSTGPGPGLHAASRAYAPGINALMSVTVNQALGLNC